MENYNEQYAYDLAILYLRSHDLSSLTPEDVFKEFDDAYRRVVKAKKDAAAK